MGLKTDKLYNLITTASLCLMVASSVPMCFSYGITENVTPKIEKRAQERIEAQLKSGEMGTYEYFENKNKIENDKDYLLDNYASDGDAKLVRGCNLTQAISTPICFGSAATVVTAVAVKSIKEKPSKKEDDEKEIG